MNETSKLLIDIERLKQTARAINKNANKTIEDIIIQQRNEFNIVYDNSEIKKLSKLLKITFKLIKDLDTAEEQLLDEFKPGE